MPERPRLRSVCGALYATRAMVPRSCTLQKVSSPVGATIHNFSQTSAPSACSHAILGCAVAFRGMDRNGDRKAQNRTRVWHRIHSSTNNVESRLEDAKSVEWNDAWRPVAPSSPIVVVLHEGGAPRTWRPPSPRLIQRYALEWCCLVHDGVTW